MFNHPVTKPTKLGEVQQLSSTSFAFAALLADHTVVCWGDPLCGGDSSEVQDQLRRGETEEKTQIPGGECIQRTHIKYGDNLIKSILYI